MCRLLIVNTNDLGMPNPTGNIPAENKRLTVTTLASSENEEPPSRNDHTLNI